MNAPTLYIKKLLFGINESQEYLCVGKEDVSDPLKVFVTGASSRENISEQHLFLGYKPVIIGIPAQRNSGLYSILSSTRLVSLLFCEQESAKDPVAELELQFVEQKEFDQLSLFLFTGIRGRHSFLSGMHQFTNNLLERMANKNENNISLRGNLYDQVRIAYAIPRVISIVTLGNGLLFNMFPTDLNGRIDDEHYVISLRRDGKVNQQVGEFKKICLSTVKSSFCKDAYRMGRNHMQALKPLEEFKISTEKSEHLRLPLPSEVLAYKELELTDSIDAGIHRLHFFKIILEKFLHPGSTLAHVHRFYAAWERKQGRKTHYLIH